MEQDRRVKERARVVVWAPAAVEINKDVVWVEAWAAGRAKAKGATKVRARVEKARLLRCSSLVRMIPLIAKGML
jgi:hypothetical protein